MISCTCVIDGYQGSPLHESYYRLNGLMTWNFTLSRLLYFPPGRNVVSDPPRSNDISTFSSISYFPGFVYFLFPSLCPSTLYRIGRNVDIKPCITRYRCVAMLCKLFTYVRETMSELIIDSSQI